MKILALAKGLGLVALCAGAGFLLATPRAKGDKAPVAPGARLDFDLVRMNATMRLTQVFRLVANPDEFAGKTLSLPGAFLTQVDAATGQRVYGCQIRDAVTCSCCVGGCVVEFVPKKSYAWPTGFPVEGSEVIVTGRVEVVKVADERVAYAYPRLVEADLAVAPAP